MTIQSPYPAITIPQLDILTYIFGSGKDLPDTKLWINAQDPTRYFTPRTGLAWIKRLAVGLDRLGVKKGEVVLHISPNTIFVPVAYLGIAGSGRVFSGANPAYTAEEMAYQMRDTGARIVLVHPSLLPTVRKAAKLAGIAESGLYQFSDEEVKPVDGIQDWRSILGTPKEGAEYQWKKLSPDELKTTVAAVNYSSGTTGLPKGVEITHANLVANVEQIISLRLGGNDSQRKEALDERWIGFLPLYHAFGQIQSILYAGKLFSPAYIMTRFVYEDMLQVIQTQRITHLPCAPPILILFAKHPATSKYDLSSIQTISSGAAPLSLSLQNACATRLNAKIGQGWGMTEVTCAGTVVPEGANDQTGSVGVLVPGCEVKLVDEAGAEVARGQRGEIYIRGPNVSRGYWKNEKATQETMLADGWLKTGDVAVANDAGWFWIVDRLKELIKVSGHQVAPAELEAVLLNHPDVADAGVVGVQASFDAQEKVRAYVSLKRPGSIKPEELQQWMQGKVAKYKWLTGGVVFVEQIPKSPAGKIQRKVMREWAKKSVQDGSSKL